MSNQDSMVPREAPGTGQWMTHHKQMGGINHPTPQGDIQNSNIWWKMVLIDDDDEEEAEEEEEENGLE